MFGIGTRAAQKVIELIECWHDSIASRWLIFFGGFIRKLDESKTMNLWRNFLVEELQRVPV